MDLALLKRRTEMLDMICKGFHPSAVITQMAENYSVSERCLWSDWERRKQWIPMLLSLEKYADFADAMETKLNAVQKAAWSTYMRASNDNAKVGALKVVLESVEVHSNAVLSRDILERLEHVEELTGIKDKEGKETMKNSKEVLKRLSGVEKKLAANAQDLEQNKKSDDLRVLLEMHSYCLNQQEMTMTREEIRKADEESSKCLLEWYAEWQKLTPEEQKESGEREQDEEVERDRAWLNSEERRQFDLQYEEYQKRCEANPTEETP